jgi:Leucine-rich repeat (LRR) protein
LNFSHNNYQKISLKNFPALTHLIVNNNQLTELFLQNTKSLRQLNCSGNPFLTNLTLDYSPNLELFNCWDINFVKNAVVPSSLQTLASTCSLTTTTLIDSVGDSALTVGLAVPLGLSMLG